jgi:hypothetical protein
MTFDMVLHCEAECSLYFTVKSDVPQSGTQDTVADVDVVLITARSVGVLHEVVFFEPVVNRPGNWLEHTPATFTLYLVLADKPVSVQDVTNPAFEMIVHSDALEILYLIM